VPVSSLASSPTVSAAPAILDRCHPAVRVWFRAAVSWFAELQVLDRVDGDTPRLQPPASQATVKAARHGHVGAELPVLER
jgi:hypothetical protein